MKYELIREIYNGCENSKMRDVEITEVETNDTDAIANRYAMGKDIQMEKFATGTGIVYEIATDGMFQKLIFSEI